MIEKYISDSELMNAEELSTSGDTQLHMYLSKAISEIRHLRHQLNDPNYMYSGRIHRQAILTRNARIEQLEKEIEKLKKTQGIK